MKCEICNFERYIEKCHIIPKFLGGGKDIDNVVFLCPNHHKLFDYALLNNEELLAIEPKILKLVNSSKYFHNTKVQQYLYYLLRLSDTIPYFLGNKRGLAIKEFGNSYF